MPSGGIGPLTAQATDVRFDEMPSFEVRYHKRNHFWRIGFALERELDRLNGAGDVQEKAPDVLLDDATRKEIEDEIGNSENGEAAGAFKKQATQIVAGNQFADRQLPYLVDCIRSACGYKPRWGTTVSDEDAERVKKVRRVFELAESDKAYERRKDDDALNFRQDLHDHAAGFLAPLISSITVGWPSDLLRAGVRLVDLPGVGIAQDTYRRVTRGYIRDQARAVILVVDRAGPTAEAVELLRTSGYWTD